ncbi:hypothetical protein BT67DRAFT_443635 [Trichocladium antarcticum]|uniref:F-box domain-containing protein n=1 Tax=Trichocladium antarcticum TaxID=1450529 RepID=A0AAN6ZCT7_9PEZI|nr:hypothetical protein BT67DRAFT_443635 [Trichocladium antarcticum]
MDSPPDDDCVYSKTEKDVESCLPATECRLLALPPELIANIFSYLSPIDLNHVAQTGRTLREHATTDYLWQALVQDNVPGSRVASPYPCASFRELFWAHHPRWFLPKYKIWFSDAGLPGRLVVVRYDQRRGCIEGYQVVANKRSSTFHTWQADDEVAIPAFDPVVKLHLDQPILRLPANPKSNAYEFCTVGSVRAIHLRRGNNGFFSPYDGAASSSSEHQEGNHLTNEIPMELSPMDEMRHTFIYARRLSPTEVAEARGSSFPYRDIWPPFAIPASQRVFGFGLHLSTPQTPLYRPSSWHDLCDRAFRIRKWLELRITQRDRILPAAHPSTANPGPLDPAGPNHAIPDPSTTPAATTHNVLALDINLPQPLGIHIGEDIATYATLSPALYTPTPSKPYRGIWVGDYSGHGCEFLLITQPHDDDDDDDDDNNDSLQAVKLTGDANVPRGEYSFVADDLGAGGLVEVAQEEPFVGVRVVRCQGHVASAGFVDDTFTDTRLFLISHDRLAQYWIALGHISYYHRVDVDALLVPT